MSLINFELELFWIVPFGEKKYHPNARLEFKVIGSEYIDRKMRKEAGEKISYSSIDQIAKRFANCAVGYRDQDHVNCLEKHCFSFYISFPTSKSVKYTGYGADFIYNIVQLIESEQVTANQIFIRHCSKISPHRFPTSDDFISNWQIKEKAAP